MTATAKLSNYQELDRYPIAGFKIADAGLGGPCRIELLVKCIRVKLVVDLINSLSVGRFESTSETIPDIDLGPFHASHLGVSRCHLFIKLQDNHVVIVDNASLNGTKLNGRQLVPKQAYPLGHGDILHLGSYELQIGLSVNPTA